MAKELPFFKFEPGQWDNGNIQICSRWDKGLFMDLCAMYWQRLGDLPYKLALQKLCAGNAVALKSLIDNEIFTIIDGHICIDFLNEQLAEFGSVSQTNSKNAREGWEKRRKQATPMRPHSDPNAIRGDKRREEEKREEETHANFDDLFLKAFDEATCESYKLAFRGFDLSAELQKFRTKCDNDKGKYYGRDVGGLRTAFQYQLQNLRNGKSKFNKAGEQSLRDLIDSGYGDIKGAGG